MFWSVCFGGIVFLFILVNADKPAAESQPHIVSIENFRGLHVAGGVLIAEDVVITCAHNIDSVTTLNVRLGSSVVGVGGQLIPVKKNCPVAGYNFQTRINDITILRLQRKAVLNNKVATVKLPIEGQTFSNLATISGWGYNIQGGLDSIAVEKVSEASCKNIYGDETLPQTSFCVNYSDNKHSCLESTIGNPLVADGTVYGVVSAAGACDLKGYPAVIAKISPQKIQNDINACA